MNHPDTLPAIHLAPVLAADIHSIGHDPATGTLAIRFKDRKTGNPAALYHYANVDAVMHQDLVSAASIDAFFRENIRPAVKAFPYRKVEQAPAAQL
jgi:hypothetical protein